MDSFLDFPDIKRKSMATIYPEYYSSSIRCTMILLSNLAAPEWISIDCNSVRITTVIICQRKETKNTSSVLMNNTKMFCPRCNILTKQKCISLFWYDNTKSFLTSFRELCKRHCLTSASDPFIAQTIQSLSNYFSMFSVLLKGQSGYQIHNLRIYQYSQYYTHNTTMNITLNSATGFFVYEKSIVESQLTNGLFHCGSKEKILSMFVCNGKRECIDGSDESRCECESFNYQKMCQFKLLSKSISQCSPLFYKSRTGKCNAYLSSQTKKHDVVNFTFPCLSNNKSSKTIHTNMKMNDLFPDCPAAVDEFILKCFLVNYTFFACQRPDQIPCLPGHPRCYSIDKLCSFRLSPYGRVLPCADGSHLQHCTDFECNAMSKCQNSYCIPFASLCDGRWDCPGGQDELHFCQTQRFCEHMFKCISGGMTTCIHIGNICDEIIDCHGGEDELLCDGFNLTCPSHCYCFVLAITCSDANSSLVLQLQMQDLPFLSVFLENMSDMEVDAFIRIFPNSSFIKLVGLNFSEICCGKMGFPSSIMSITVESSGIDKLLKFCFHSYSQLLILNLDQNKITRIEGRALENLTSLSVLSLTGNPIQHLSADFANNCSHNSSFGFVLHMMDVDIRHIDQNSFQSVSVELLTTTDFYLCCLVQDSKCTAKIPWHTSCQKLLSSSVVRFTFLSFSILILVVNSLSICIHVVWRKLSLSFSLTVLAANTNDLLCCLYISIISIADIFFDNSFGVWEQYWRSSFFCSLAFNTAMTFLVMTQMISLFLSLSRLQSIKCPLDTKFKEPQFVKKMLQEITLVSVCVGLVPTSISYLTHGSFQNVLCFPLTDHSCSSSSLVSVITVVLSLSLVTSAVIIAIFHCLLIQGYLQHKTTIGTSKSHKDSSKTLVFQLGLTTVLNMLSWFPCVMVCLIALFLPQYPMGMLFWTIALSLTLNSYVNPVIFVIFTLRKVFQQASKQKCQR